MLLSGVRYPTIIKTHSFLILVLWIILWTMKKNEQGNVQEKKITPNDHEGWHFLYWEENPNFASDEQDA